MKKLPLSMVCALSVVLSSFSGAQLLEKVEPSVSPQQAIEAALEGKPAPIQQALAEGFKVDTQDPNGRTLLMYASFNGHTNVMDVLVKAGADVNAQDKDGSSALMFGASGPSPATVKRLLEAGATIDMIDNNEHFTALMWAAAEGQLPTVQLLLQYNADITLKDIDGDTAESFAAQKGHTAIAQLLKDAAK